VRATIMQITSRKERESFMFRLPVDFGRSVHPLQG
jgi:hypothetical protein